MDIMALSSALHSTAVATGGPNSVDLVAWIGVPLFLALCGAVFGIIKGAIRFAQYMTRTEKTQDATAASNEEIRSSLSTFIDKTDERLAKHSEDLAVIQYALGNSGGNARKLERLDAERETASHRMDRTGE